MLTEKPPNGKETPNVYWFILFDLFKFLSSNLIKWSFELCENLLNGLEYNQYIGRGLNSCRPDQIDN